MTPQALLNKIIAIEAFADELKFQAIGLRSDLERIYAPAPKRGKKKVFTAQQEALIIAKRIKTIMRSK